MKNLYNSIYFLFEFIWKNNKLWIVFTAMKHLLLVIFISVSVVFPKFIINTLLGSKRVDILLYLVTGYAFLLFVVNQIRTYLEYLLTIEKGALCKNYDIKIQTTMSNIEYKYFALPETLDLHARVFKKGFNEYCDVIEGLFDILQNILVIISIFSIIITTSPIMILILGVKIFFGAISNFKANKKNHSIRAKIIAAERKIWYYEGLFGDFAYGKEFKLFNLKSLLLKKYSSSAVEIMDALKLSLVHMEKTKTFQTLITFFQYEITYGYLIFEVIMNGLTLGSFNMLYNALNQFTSSIDDIIVKLISISRARLDLEDLERFSNLVQKIEACGQQLPTDKYVVEFKNVSFKYPLSDKYALKDINIKIDFMEHISIVGANGSGKTTFVKLLLGLYNPMEGQILVNGVDIIEIKFQEYIKLFAVVFQDFKLFAGTIEENIAFENNSDKPNEILSAIHQSGFKKDYISLAKGIQTHIYKVFEADGIELSGGQGQKIAIARAIFKDSPIIIFDEPTASLDPLAEYDIYESLELMTKNKSSIFISHRLVNTRFSEKIYVFDGGRISEAGTHDELIKQNGIYAAMYGKQSEFFVQLKEASN